MSFASSKQQQQVVQLLQRSLERGRLGHAYLFTGPELGGLEAMARTLAKTLHCEQPARRAATGPAVDCCDHCRNCQRIDGANHPDVQWVRPESKSRVITIEQMRDLMQTVQLKPLEGGHKVAVIVAAERLNVQAANAFLKTLEEPPAQSVLVLLSTEPQRLLETILSRCLRLSFSGEGHRSAHPAQMSWLKLFGELAGGEQQTVLDRYRLLGRLLGGLAELKTTIEKDLTARSPLERYEDVEPALREKWEEELSAAIEAEYRRQRAELLAGLQSWLRDVWVQTLGLHQHLGLPELAEATQRVARRLSADAAVANLRIVAQTQRLLESNVQEALALEVGLLRLTL